MKVLVTGTSDKIMQSFDIIERYAKMIRMEKKFLF